MSRSFFGLSLERVLCVSPRRGRAERRKSRLSLYYGGELLEIRALLATVDVHVVNFAFNPDPVTINPGDTIHWIWDTNNHSTTSVPGQAETWDSGVHNSGFTFDHTFTQAGTYSYYCTIHGQLVNGRATGMVGTITVNAPQATLASIAVTPANPSIVSGTTQQFTATGTYSDNSTQNITGQVTWASATPAVATINAAGVATGVAAGTSTISATMNGVTGSTLLTVNAATLQSIAVTPATPSIAVGATRQFTAMGTFSNNTTQDITGLVTWASATPAVATINAAGVATGVTVGTSSISAAMNGVTGSTLLTVTPAPTLSSIMVMPVSASTSVDPGKTEQFMAMGTFSDGSVQDLTGQVTWSSSNTTVATISNTPGSQGLATGLAPGTSNIIATLNGITGSLPLTVNPLPVTLTSVQFVSNKRHLVTQILVSFSGAVNVTEASRVGTYRLATAGKKGSFDAKNAGIIKLKSAVATGANTVRLIPKKAFAISKTIQFRVDGIAPSGLQDSLNRLIDGNHDGQAGGNAIALLSKKGATLQ